MTSAQIPVLTALLTAHHALILLIVQNAILLTFLPTTNVQLFVLRIITQMGLPVKFVLSAALNAQETQLALNAMNRLITSKTQTAKLIAKIIALIIIRRQIQIANHAQILIVSHVMKLINAGLAILNII